EAARLPSARIPENVRRRRLPAEYALDHRPAGLGSGADRGADRRGDLTCAGASAGITLTVIASQRVRPEVAGPMKGSAKQSSGLCARAGAHRCALSLVGEGINGDAKVRGTDYFFGALITSA